MTRKLYPVRALLDAGKAVVRGAIGAVGTEEGTDHDLILFAATRLLFGGQVAAKYIADQRVPSSADATHREQLAERLGLTFAKPACPARGLLALLGGSEGFRLAAGTEVVFPATAFPDAVARTYRTLEDVDAPGALDGAAVPLVPGSGIHKLRPKSAEGVAAFRARDVAEIKADGGASTWLAVVRRANAEDQSLELYLPVPGLLREAGGETVRPYATGAVVPVVCTTPGNAGNAPPALSTVSIEGVEPTPHAMLLELGGGGEETGEVDRDPQRTVRLLEDALACPPSFGNDQHWREVALACPDVALDDAIVYRHVRGPGTIDIVCIGPSGGLRAPAFPETNLAFVPWGLNTRRIGEVQAARVEAWCKAQASYFDDVRVRSVEWDHRGNTFAESGTPRFLHAVGRIDLNVTPAFGYGPDAGVVLEMTPHTRHASRLYPARLGVTLPTALAPGQRIWAAVGHETTAGRHAFATVVTEILSIAHDRSYATIRSVQGLLPTGDAQAFGASDALKLAVLRWGTAGPVTQPVLDRVYAYFDQLGPGSYLVAAKGPGYVQRFWGSTPATPLSGMALTRWPSEGRRWSSGVRASELRAELLTVAGVESVRIGKLADDLIDYDPAPLMTAALSGVLPRYA